MQRESMSKHTMKMFESLGGVTLDSIHKTGSDARCNDRDASANTTTEDEPVRPAIEEEAVVSIAQRKAEVAENCAELTTQEEAVQQQPVVLSAAAPGGAKRSAQLSCTLPPAEEPAAANKAGHAEAAATKAAEDQAVAKSADECVIS